MSSTTIIFCYIEKTSPETCGGEIEKNEMIKSIIKKQVSLCSLDLDWFFWFVFEKVSSSLPMLLVMLVAHVAQRSKSHSQMLFNTVVLRNFAIFTGKHVCWSLFFNKISGLNATQVFFCEYCETFNNSFFIEDLLIILFRNFT